MLCMHHERPVVLSYGFSCDQTVIASLNHAPSQLHPHTHTVTHTQTPSNARTTYTLSSSHHTHQTHPNTPHTPPHITPHTQLKRRMSKILVPMCVHSTRPVLGVASCPPPVTPQTMCSPLSSPQTSQSSTGSSAALHCCANSTTDTYSL